MYVCVHLYTIRYYTVHGSWAVQLSALVNGFQNICCWILGHCRREWSNMIQMFRTWWDTTHWLPTAKCPRLQLGSGPWKSSPSIGWLYPLVMTNIAIENGNRNSGFTHEKIVIFHSYVSLPEGNPMIHPIQWYPRPHSWDSSRTAAPASWSPRVAWRVSRPTRRPGSLRRRGHPKQTGEIDEAKQGFLPSQRVILHRNMIMLQSLIMISPFKRHWF